MRFKSRAWLLFLAVSSLSIFSIDTAKACSADTYIRNCTSAVAEIEAFKSSLASGASAAAAANGSNMNGNSLSLSNATRDSASADTQGATYCQQQLTQCLSQCTKPSDQAQLQRCKQSAGSPSPSNGASSAGSESPSGGGPAIETPKASCSGDSSYLYDKCSAQLSVECKGKFTGSSLCEQFSKRYCDASASKSTSQASAGAMPSGQGKGSDYCMAFQGGDFCAKTAGSEVCPSCSHKIPDPSGKLPEVCMRDPAYSNPLVAQASAAAAADISSAAVHIADREASQSSEGHGSGLPKLSSLDGSGGGSSGEPFKFQKLGASRLPASADANGMRVAATDVSVKVQSLFQLSSEVLLQRCSRGQLLHCGSK